MPTAVTNRVQAAIDRCRAKDVDAKDVAALDEKLALTSAEHFAYQQAQSRAYAEGVLSADEAHIVYMALGECCSSTNGGWSADVDTITKAVVTTLIGELLRRRTARC